MAQNAYQVFKSTYNQAIADGLSTSVATAAAQSAMDDVLRQQAVQTPLAQAFTSVPGARVPDPGPSIGGSLDSSSRGARLGMRK